MRITETCCCGATLEIVFNPEQKQTWTSGTTEAQEAKKAQENWRKRHRSCLPSHPALAADDPNAPEFWDRVQSKP